jgi:hypothetical protein
VLTVMPMFLAATMPLILWTYAAIVSFGSVGFVGSRSSILIIAFSTIENSTGDTGEPCGSELLDLSWAHKHRSKLRAIYQSAPNLVTQLIKYDGICLSFMVSISILGRLLIKYHGLPLWGDHHQDRMPFSVGQVTLT